MACDDDVPDFIVFGDIIPVMFKYQGTLYSPYRHHEDVYSKTSASHFRMGAVIKEVNIFGRTIFMPSMLEKLCNRLATIMVLGSKGVELGRYLPYPTDLLSIMRRLPPEIRTISHNIISLSINPINIRFNTVSPFLDFVSTATLLNDIINGDGDSATYTLTPYAIGCIDSERWLKSNYERIFPI